MDLVQDATGHVTGSLRVLGVGFSIEGTVTGTRFSWHLAHPGCQTFQGDLTLTVTGDQATAMDGTASQDNRACIANGVINSGPMNMSRLQ